MAIEKVGLPSKSGDFLQLYINVNVYRVPKLLFSVAINRPEGLMITREHHPISLGLRIEELVVAANHKMECFVFKITKPQLPLLSISTT